MTELAAAVAVSAAHAAIVTEIVPAEQVIDGAPVQGTAVLATSGELEVGLWELSVGSVRDTEVDEVFVVISGRATVEILGDGDRVTSTLELQTGSLVRLSEGMRTVWRIHETLRKLYVTL